MRIFRTKKRLKTLEENYKALDSIINERIGEGFFKWYGTIWGAGRRYTSITAKIMEIDDKLNMVINYLGIEEAETKAVESKKYYKKKPVKRKGKR